jgi:hypothetical protein
MLNKVYFYNTDQARLYCNGLGGAVSNNHLSIVCHTHLSVVSHNRLRVVSHNWLSVVSHTHLSVVSHNSLSVVSHNHLSVVSHTHLSVLSRLWLTTQKTRNRGEPSCFVTSQVSVPAPLVVPIQRNCVNSVVPYNIMLVLVVDHISLSSK